MNRTIILISFVVILASCESESIQTEINEDELQVTIGRICGWCAGADSLTITENITTYDFWKCNEMVATESGQTNEAHWNSIISLLDIDEFTRININECGVCYDGCETWISIRDSTLHHQIRFVNVDTSVLDPVFPLIAQLDSIRMQFRTNAED